MYQAQTGIFNHMLKFHKFLINSKIYFLFYSNVCADEAMEDCGFLKFTDNTMKASFLQALNTMRKHRLFCDVVINVSVTQPFIHKQLCSQYALLNKNDLKFCDFLFPINWFDCCPTHRKHKIT